MPQERTLTSDPWSLDLRPSREDVIELLSHLVAIDSVNPSLVSGAAGEAAIAGFVARWLHDEGLEVSVPEVSPGRPNVIARLPARSSGPAVMLNAHLDTVGVAGMDAPFQPRVDGDRLYGRGAYDMKASLAAIMLASRSLARQEGTRGDVIVTAVADEEYASAGTRALLRTLKADAAIVTEPTGLRVCLAHKGFSWMAIETRGVAAHGSKPDLGVDAIGHAGRVLVELERLGGDLAGREPHPLLGNGSVHASLIEGGQELSSYPESCRLQLERRTLPGDTPDSVAGEIHRVLEHLGAADASFHATCEQILWRDAFEVDPYSPIVRTLAAQVDSVLGSPPEFYGDTAWMDAALLSAAGIPTVVFGPGGSGAHAAIEWASIDQTAMCAEILARTAWTFCNAP
jgi:acetylornithine deacetylase